MRKVRLLGLAMVAGLVALGAPALLGCENTNSSPGGPGNTGSKNVAGQSGSSGDDCGDAGQYCTCEAFKNNCEALIGTTGIDQKFCDEDYDRCQGKYGDGGIDAAAAMQEFDCMAKQQACFDNLGPGDSDNDCFDVYDACVNG